MRKKGDKRRKRNRPTSTTLSWFWIVPPGGNDAVELTLDCLEQLFEDRIREKWTLNYGMSVSYEYYQGHRRIEVETTVAPEYEHRVRTLFIETLRDIPAVLAEVPERKSNFRKTHEVFDQEVDSTIENAVYDLLSIGRIQPIAEAVASYEAVTEDEVRRVLTEILCPERYFLEIEEA